MKPFAFLAGALLTVPFVAVRAEAQANAGGAAGNCDRACLTSIADGYFAALGWSDFWR